MTFVENSLCFLLYKRIPAAAVAAATAAVTAVGVFQLLCFALTYTLSGLCCILWQIQANVVLPNVVSRF